MIPIPRGNWGKWVLVATAVVVVLMLARIHEQDELRKAPGFSPPRPWEVFSPPEEPFMVEMPGSPKREAVNKTEWGINFEVCSYTGTDAGMAFTVAYYDCPRDSRVNWTAEALLNALREKLHITHEGGIIKEEPVSVRQPTALKVSVDETKVRKMSKYLLLPAGSRCYVLVVGGTYSVWDDRLAERFLTSFRLKGSTTSSRGGP